MCRGKHGRHGGYPVLWASSEKPGRVAKIAPLGERLSGMCGSVQHVRFSPVSGRARLCSPSSIEVSMGKRKQERRKKRNQKFIDSLKNKAMRLDWIAKSSGMSDNGVADMLDLAHWSFTQTEKWKEVRRQAVEKYGTTCAKCGRPQSPGYPVNIDHIKPRKFYPHLAYDLDNLQPLCGPCNKEKGNGPPVDYRKITRVIQQR